MDEFTPDQLASSGSPTPAVSLTGPIWVPQGMTFDTAGDLWATDAGTTPGVYEFTPGQLIPSGTTSPFGVINGSNTTIANPTNVLITEPPVVTSINPTAGGGGGGTTVTINGAGFNYGSTVDFGTEAASSVTYVSPYELTAVAPPGAGPVHVTVSTFAGTSLTSRGRPIRLPAGPHQAQHHEPSRAIPTYSSGGGFTATVSTNSNGTPSVTSSTTSVCTASGLVVTYVSGGQCTLTAQVAASTTYAAAVGSAQSFSSGAGPHPAQRHEPSQQPDLQLGGRLHRHGEHKQQRHAVGHLQHDQRLHRQRPRRDLCLRRSMHPDRPGGGKHDLRRGRGHRGELHSGAHADDHSDDHADPRLLARGLRRRDFQFRFKLSFMDQPEA